MNLAELNIIMNEKYRVWHEAEMAVQEARKFAVIAHAEYSEACSALKNAEIRAKRIRKRKGIVL